METQRTFIGIDEMGALAASCNCTESSGTNGRPGQSLQEKAGYDLRPYICGIRNVNEKLPNWDKDS